MDSVVASEAIDPGSTPGIRTMIIRGLRENADNLESTGGIGLRFIPKVQQPDQIAPDG
jgi:hypothetical protein